MADVVGIIFPNGIKTYYFDPAGLEFARGDRVVVQTANGPEIGQVAEPNHTIEDSALPAPLKKVTRLATDKDLEAQAASQNLRKQAMITCREMIAAHRLDMKLVGADIAFGGEKITFSFYAEERVDFRSLVADLAKALKTRIELRQVGAREEARMVGGLGPCGRGLCCTLFPPGDDPVSIRMAKEQNLPLNPAKISGLCGRLMCCLKYEQEQYVRFRKEAPPKGTSVATPDGQGAVVGYNVLKDAIVVRLEDGHATDVKLCCCQRQEGGGLIYTPDESELPPEIAFPAVIGGIRRLVASEDPVDEELAVIEAEVILGEDGQPIDVIIAEGSRRPRRRGRGRRGGRGRAAGEGGALGEAGAAGEPAATGAGRAEGGEGARSGDNRDSGVRHQGQHPQRHPERHRGGVPGHKSEGGPGGAPGGAERSRPRGPEDGAEGGQEGAPGTGPRRRRRRRRPGGGGEGGGGANGGGGEGGSGGGPAPAGGGD